MTWESSRWTQLGRRFLLLSLLSLGLVTHHGHSLQTKTTLAYLEAAASRAAAALGPLISTAAMASESEAHVEQSDVEMADGDASMPDASNKAVADDKMTDPPGDDSDSSISAADQAFLDELTDNEDKDDNTNEDNPKDPSEALLKALEHKETGNTHFASQNLIEASRAYRKGISLLKPFNQANSGDEQIKILLVTMNTNLSMVCYKQQKYKLAKDAAGKSLEIDASNVKALYRRALAHRALGDEDLALNDLKCAYKLDEKNAAVKKEIANIRKGRELAKKNEKERLQKAFSSGSLLYGDKEEEERQAAKRREKERKEQEEREAKEKERLKKLWEDDCVERLKNEEEVLDYEAWDAERVKREKEEKERKEAERKKAEKKKREERKAAAKANQKDDTDSEDELTEKELAMLRGYKKTSDGRTTSYFTREQTDKEKELIGCIQPKRLESNASESAASSTTEQQQTAKVGSVWNQAGTTWEEKDTTDWCKSCLTECLLESMSAHASEFGSSSTYIARVKSVDALSGDASVALAGGKKRYIYDFHTELKYEIRNEENECIGSGSLKLPDINSAHTAEEELEVEILRWKKSPGGNCDVNGVETCRDLLVGEVRKSVLKFVERFNTNF